MENKNKDLLEDFVAYCGEHPEERFWQALRNWMGVGYIYVAEVVAPTVSADTDEASKAFLETADDTFYWDVDPKDMQKNV